MIAALQTAIAAALASPELQAKLVPQGVAFAPGSSAEFVAFLRRDMARWREAVAVSGAKVE